VKINSKTANGFTLHKLLVVVTILAVLATQLAEHSAAGETSAATNTPTLKTYTVGIKVSAFPTNENLSTPQAAYANLNRKVAREGWDAFRDLSTRAVRESLDRDPKARSLKGKPLPKERAAQYAGAEVLEVWCLDRVASVIAKFPSADGSNRFDYRGFAWEDQRWLNTGEGIADTLDAARESAQTGLAYDETQEKLKDRPSIAEPERHLRPFVDFLRSSAEEPRGFLLRAVATHQVVLLGEVHHRPPYWAFNQSLVRAKAFAERVGVIYLELPGNDQALVDQFLAGPKCDPQPIIEVLRDMLWAGWPDQPMLDFFKAVWEVNQSLPQRQQLRVVLVDLARPWKAIASREDWRKYDGDRNEIMAANVQRDLRAHAKDGRHALFIVGWMHATKNLSTPGGEPIQSMGWRLGETLGATNVFAVFPHCPVMSNVGEVEGRLALGLFERAFAAMTNRPMAFPLDHGPFGQLPFDAASLDFLTPSSYAAAFDAYLYLGPLEDEVFSPLIPGFYTDEFVLELDRRHRLDSGQGLKAAYGFSKLDAESFVQWMGNTWGQPRREWSAFQLGPMDAWQSGGNSPKGSLAKSAWSSKGQATPEASLETMLRAMSQGDRQSFQACLPPGAKLDDEEFDREREKGRAAVSFAIVSKETISEGEAILGVDLAAESGHHRVRIIMKKMEGNWRCAGNAE
jgi:hypothetical protein